MCWKQPLCHRVENTHLLCKWKYQCLADLFDWFGFDQTGKRVGRGGGQVVSVLTFHSDDPSSNPAEAYSFFL